MENTENNVVKLSEIEAKPVIRNRTFIDELDWILGITKNPEVGSTIGLLKGKIILMAGECGVGKSRLAIQISKNFCRNYINGEVLYIQTESPLEDFATWAKDTSLYDNFYCSGEDKIDKIVDLIYEIKPKLIIIDSVNEIEEFENGNKQEARCIIKGSDEKHGLKQAVYDVGGHLILLAQLNQDGKTIKGGTSLPHLVDVALNICSIKKGDFEKAIYENCEKESCFKVEVGTKHRYGPRTPWGIFAHTATGVKQVSFNWLKDPRMKETELRETFNSYHAPVSAVPAPIVPAPIVSAPDPDLQPSMYVAGEYMGEPTKVGGVVWTIKTEKDYERIKAEAVANGEIKLDSNGKIIPKREGVGLYTRFNNFLGKTFFS